jgi:hypothetical protein
MQAARGQALRPPASGSADRPPRARGGSPASGSGQTQVIAKFDRNFIQQFSDELWQTASLHRLASARGAGREELS